MSLRYEPSSEPLHISVKAVVLKLRTEEMSRRADRLLCGVHDIRGGRDGAVPVLPPPTVLQAQEDHLSHLHVGI